MSQITVIGNIGGNPELKFTNNNNAVLNFSVAENHSRKNQSGEWENIGTTWRRVAFWGGRGITPEQMSHYLNVGTRVIIVGDEMMREWEKQDGTKGNSLELNARSIGIIPNVPSQQAPQQQPGAQQQTQPTPPSQPTPPAQAQGQQQNMWTQPPVANYDWGVSQDNTPPF